MTTLILNWKKNRTVFLWIILVFLSISLLSSCSKRNHLTYLRGDLKSVFAQAKLMNKKVFVLITDSACGNCKMFDKRIEAEDRTVKILQKDYLCYKADVQDFSEQEIAKITRCTTFPFPYFFSKDGELLAFGFPNKPEFDITSLDSIHMSQFGFEEIFKFNITLDQYKKLVTASLKGVLEEPKEINGQLHSAGDFFQKSTEIALYPFNIKRYLKFSPFIEKDTLFVNRLRGFKFSEMDIWLYGEPETYLGRRIGPMIGSANNISQNGYVLIDSVKDLGLLKKGKQYSFTFRVKNLSPNPLVIRKVSHPCDCIQLKWSSKKIEQDNFSTINCRFTPYAEGEFVKEIYVHSNSAKQPMGIFKITGNVNQ